MGLLLRAFQSARFETQDIKGNTMKVANSIVIKVAALAATTVMLSHVAQAADCKPNEAIKTVEPGTLTIATFDFPPFDVPKDGAFTGVDGDIITPFAEKNCLKIATVLLDPAAVIQALSSGKADMSAGQWYRTEARTKVMDISNPLYLDQLGIFSKDGFTKISQIEGKQVGTVQGYNWVADLQKVLGSNLKLYPTAVALAQDLAAGRVEVGIDSYAAGVYAQKEQGGYPGLKIVVGEPDERVRASIAPAQTGFLFGKGNPELTKLVNAYIDDLQAKTGVAAILTKYGFDPSGADVGDSRLIK